MPSKKKYLFVLPMAILLPNSNVAKGLFKKEDILAAAVEDAYYVLVQFNEIPSQAVKDNLKKSGVELNAFLPGNAYLAVSKKSFDFSKASLFNIRSVNIIPAVYKIDSRLINYKASADRSETQVFAVSYFESADRSKVQAALINAGAIIQSSKFDHAGIIFYTGQPGYH